MNKLSEAEFLLEKMKGQLCLHETGEVFRLCTWTVEKGTVSEKVRGWFGKTVKEETPTYISSISSQWTKHLGTTYYSVKATDSTNFLDMVNSFWKCRERFVKMSQELSLFELAIRKKEELALKQKVDEAVARGASSVEIGEIVGKELGIL